MYKYKYKYTGKIMAPSWTITALPSIAKQPSTCVNIDASCTAVDLFTGQVSLFWRQQIIALSANRDGVVTGQELTWKLGKCQNFPTFNTIILYCDKTVALMLTIMTQQWQKIAKARSMQACMVSPISNCFCLPSTQLLLERELLDILRPVGCISGTFSKLF